MPHINESEAHEVEAQQETQEETKRFGPFKVLRGRWIGNDPDTRKEVVKDKGSPPFYAQSDLLQYNFPGMGAKFALVGGETQFTTQRTNPVPPRTTEQRQATDGLDELTVNELKQYAADNEISLEGTPNRKADIVAAIRNHQNQPLE